MERARTEKGIELVFDNMGEVNDLELIHEIGNGCEDSFRILFRKWAPRLGRFLARATGSPEVAEDLLQEAFLRIFRAAPRFVARGRADAWLYRICANLAYSYWRRETASPLRGSIPLDPTADTHPARFADPEFDRMKSALQEATRSALRRIPENQRLVFLLKVDQGLTYEEIASVLRCPEGTAKSRFHHAVQKLRAAMKDWDDPLENRMRE